MERTEEMTSAAAPPHEISGAYIDWAAVLGGAVVAAAIAGVCTAFGAALGLTTISAEPGEGSGLVLLVVTGLWMVASLVLSYMAGGYVAGRMRRRVDNASADEVSARDGINGLVVWGIGMLLTAWMAAGVIGGAASAVGTATTAAGNAVGGIAQATGSVVGGTVQGVAQGIGAAIPNASSNDGQNGGDSGLMDYINSTLMRPVFGGVQQSNDGTTDPGAPAQDDAALARQTGIVLGNVMRTGEISDDDRAFLTAAVAQRTGLSEAEVTARVDQAVTKVQEARAEIEKAAADAKAEVERLAQEAKDKAIAAAEIARKGAILTAFVLAAAALVAGAASVVGAVRGGRHRDEGRIWGGFSYRL